MQFIIIILIKFKIVINMKKIFYSVALMAVLSVAAVGCQKETIVEQQDSVSEVNTMYTLHYFVNGVPHSETLSSEDEYNAILLRLLALAREGYEVVVSNGNGLGIESLSKEVITYTTTKESEAVAWTKKKVDEGYMVNISYNQETGVYTCIAYR